MLAKIKRIDETVRSNVVDRFVKNIDDQSPLDEFLFDRYGDDDNIQIAIREFVFNRNRIVRSRF